MKRVLIIGKNSYIGNHIASWLLRSPETDYIVDKISVRTDEWKENSFLGYDVLIHVAGLVHHPEIRDEELYHKINTDLPVAVAKKAKEEGVGQFLFFSTMAVYGAQKSLKGTIITKETKPAPIDPYGRSKYQAEHELLKLSDESFKVVIIRPPNVYGKGCPGNYISKFVSVVRKLPAIPDAYHDVKQSMLYIDNLTELVRLLIERQAEGIYMPQDERPVSAVELMEGIAEGLSMKRKRSLFLGLLMRMLCWTSLVQKAYGGVMYGEDLNPVRFFYNIVTTQYGIVRSVSS